MELCDDFVCNKDGIDGRNVADLRSMAIALEIPTIEAKVEEVLLKNFLEIRHSEQFRRLPIDYLQGILSSRCLVVNKESDVLETIIEWAKEEPERKSELQTLMKCIRLGQLEDRQLLEITSDQNRMIMENEESLKKVERTLKRRFLSDSEMPEKRMRMSEEMDWPRNSTAGSLILAGGVNDGNLHFTITKKDH